MKHNLNHVLILNDHEQWERFEALLKSVDSDMWKQSTMDPYEYYVTEEVGEGIWDVAHDLKIDVDLGVMGGA
jgi:hypothetical protein